jgi:thioredoxin 1
MQAANQDTFEEQVSKGTVVAYFTAPWCGPCKIIRPILQEIEDENDDITIVKIDIEEHPDMADVHSVMGIPSLHVYVDGVLSGKMTGARSKQLILNEIRTVQEI